MTHVIKTADRPYWLVLRDSGPGWTLDREAATRLTLAAASEQAARMVGVEVEPALGRTRAAA